MQYYEFQYKFSETTVAKYIPLQSCAKGTNCSTYLRQYTVMMASTLGEIDSSQNWKKQFAGFSRKIVLKFVGMCPECQLQKSKKSLKSTVTKPIRSSRFRIKRTSRPHWHANKSGNERAVQLLASVPGPSHEVYCPPTSQEKDCSWSHVNSPWHLLSHRSATYPTKWQRKGIQEYWLGKMIRELWPRM